MNKSKISVPVYMNFFNRPDTFEFVFNAVREARPSKLFLACDGPRENRPDDIKNILKCQEIASNIDWECEVHRNYSDKNLRCGMRMNSGITWAFSYVDRLIILEDDCVPTQDFFVFCEEMLEKYKDDCRIHMVNAMNHLGVYKATSNSYFFGPGCCWGWATWKRAWKYMDYDMGFLDDEYSMKCVERKYPFYKNAIKTGKERLEILKSGGQLSAWTYQSGMASALESQMAIVPSVNLIKNIGLTTESEHATNDIKKLPKSQQAYFNAKTYSMEFPLKHPKYIVEDWNYYDIVQEKFKVTKITRLEGYLRQFIYAQKGERKEFIKKVLKKVFFIKK